MDTIKSPFTATATASGGRNGHTEANDGSVRADLGSKKAATDCREVMHKRQITVAVVDDDPNILDSVRELLNAKGFIAEPFESAEGFLASGVIPRVDCLLLDIQLAGASGIELRHHLGACGSKMPVIFMTGLDDEALHRQALNAGCVALLHKPFLEHQLIDAIEKAVPYDRTARKQNVVGIVRRY